MTKTYRPALDTATHTHTHTYMTNNFQSRLFPTENASGTSHFGSLSLGRGMRPHPARWELRLNSLCRILEEGVCRLKGIFLHF